MIIERQPIPAGLELMAPGVELAAVLDGIDIARLDGFDAVIVMQAYARLEAHMQARKATVMAEVGLYEISVSGMEKMAEPDKNSPDEVRSALGLTRRAAEREYGFAYDLKVRLPRVRDALSAGLIDKARAVVFCDWLEDVPVELARAVADHLLPKAGKWTTSELREKIKKLLIAADPAWARRKYERAVHQRRVIGVRHADGSASITGEQLPVDQAAAAIARVDAIAVRAKKSGLHAPIDHVRADVFLGLLEGSMSGLDDDAIIAVLFANAARKAAGEEDDYDDQLSDAPFDDPDPHGSDPDPQSWDDPDSRGWDDPDHTGDDFDGDDGDDDGGRGDSDDGCGDSHGGTPDDGGGGGPGGCGAGRADAPSDGDDGDDGCGDSHADAPNDGNDGGGGHGGDGGPGSCGDGRADDPDDGGDGGGGRPAAGGGGGHGGSGDGDGDGSEDDGDRDGSKDNGDGDSGHGGHSRSRSRSRGDGGAGSAQGSSVKSSAGVVEPVGFAAGELRVQVSTLMHLDDLPSELAGWGPIHAHLARRLAKRQIGGEWRFAICDEDGHLLYAGITRRRPAGWPRRPAPPPPSPPASRPAAGRERDAGPVGGRGSPPALGPVSAAPYASDSCEAPGPGCAPGISSRLRSAADTASAGIGGTRAKPARESDQEPQGDPRARAVSVRRRGIVELQFPLSLLRALYADIYAQGGWAGVIADVMRQYDQAIEESFPTDDDGHGHSAGDGAAGDGSAGDGSAGDASVGDASAVDEAAWDGAAGDGAAADGPVRQGAVENDAAGGSVVGCGAAGGDERRRFPTAGLRRRIEIRDRVCSHPGCRAPATRSELDHTRQYAHGGLTTEDNLAAACAHDHDLRDNGWRVVQTAPGHVTWISRTGHHYPVQPPPIIESLPEPFAPGGWAMPGRSGTGGVGGLAAFGYGAGSITDPANDELPFLPTWTYEPAWWEEPIPAPSPAQETGPETTSGPPADPADDIPPF
ncbi:HNH endonuclease signature motif containing protein [Microtetraspora sp. NBRC 16547]|uniref:HNH endonuclease signature motif containing protein n=1 Tax=Microtetraspora sp. NBRC 16547 TaxID=3030993 RepID=UPI0024A06216|nr:HNH endonuclease signature motif containing protein [Microtetraspora sp. NBRC 16547]GLW99140.1 hypothetical protein Misp02_32270 [Microtetraspora sp. NBRC 16547]